MTSHHYCNCSARHRNASGIFRRRPRGSYILGVCAGIADAFSLDPTVVRLAALLLLWVFTIPTALVYLLLAWLDDTR